MASRQAHLDLHEKLRQQGKMSYAAALMNDEGQMVGSMIVCAFETRAEVDAWLKTEPYVESRVWEKIEITPCKVAPLYAKISFFKDVRE